MCPEMHCNDHAGGPKHPNRALALRPCGRGGAWRRWHSQAPPAPSSRSSWRTPSFPASPIRFLSLVCHSEAIHSALSCITGATALCISVCLSLLMGGSEFIVVLHLHHLGPPTWVALNLVQMVSSPGHSPPSYAFRPGGKKCYSYNTNRPWADE